MPAKKEKRLFSEHQLGDLLLQYYLEGETMGLVLVPASQKEQICPQKDCSVDSLVQLKLAGDVYAGGFSQGRTLRNGESVSRLRFQSQAVEETKGEKRILTHLWDERGYLLTHTVSYRAGEKGIEIGTSFANQSGEEAKLEMLSSFSISGVTPFAEGEAPNTLLLHRFRSKWSMEGRLETTPLEALQLEPSWSRGGVACERFGQVGTMPVRGFFPFCAVEDRVHGTVWAAQLCWAGSWQMEPYRRDWDFCLSGGLADRELGHWVKNVGQGEEFTTPKARLTAVQGDLHMACQRLTSMGERAMETVPAVEQDLPIIFNEFCTSWGTPTTEQIEKMANRLKGRGITYFVIDCGWYADNGVNWSCSMGDWKVSGDRFPNGLGEAVETIRKCGMRPGLWFEMENCGEKSAAYHQTDHLLKRDGLPITAGSRRFWDLQDPWVMEYLSQRVIGLLKEYNFAYLKVDYNETLGIGCDGAESLGEGLRRQVEASQEFFRRIRKELPDLVIENCASGGHRLEPSMMELTSMASFSDAHECREIPIIAANLHQLILPRQSQIWAVLRQSDTDQRLIYSLVNTMLGRMCLSGDIFELSERQWELVDRAIAFYREVSPIIKKGFSRRYGSEILAYGHPEGWQAVLRESDGEEGTLAVLHTFGGELPHTIEVPADRGKIVSIFGGAGEDISMQGKQLIWRPNAPFSAVAVHLR